MPAAMVAEIRGSWCPQIPPARCFPAHCSAATPRCRRRPCFRRYSFGLLWSVQRPHHHKLAFAFEPPANILGHVRCSRRAPVPATRSKNCARLVPSTPYGVRSISNGSGAAMSAGFRITACSFIPSRMGIITSAALVIMEDVVHWRARPLVTSSPAPSDSTTLVFPAESSVNRNVTLRIGNPEHRRRHRFQLRRHAPL